MKDHRQNSKERLVHIQQAIKDIELFIQDINEESFLNDQLTASAVLFKFSIIGEAVNHIKEDFLDKYDYPWYKVRAFRNLISHAYFQIKMEAVWQIIVNDLPEIKQLIDTILKQEFKS